MASEEFKRGQEIISADLAAERASKLIAPDDFGLTWGGVVLPSTEATTHFCVVGATGSGKTMLLRLLMQSTLPLIGSPVKARTYTQEVQVVTPPSQREWDIYNAALATYEEQVRAQEAALKTHQEQIIGFQKFNEEVRKKNRSITEQKAALDRQLQQLPDSTGPIPGLKRWLIAIPATFFGAAMFGPGYVTLPVVFGMTAVPTTVVIVMLILKGMANGRLEEEKLELKGRNQAIKLLKEQPEPAPLARSALLEARPARPEGKTTVTKKITKAKPDTGDGHRALIYDAKSDIMSILAGMKLDCPVKILNPFDARAVAWDLAKDFATPTEARQLATLLIPEQKNASQPFFSNSARDLVTHAMLALMEIKPEEWTFRDLILALQTRENLTTVLNKTAQGRIKIKTYFDNATVGNNILSEITTGMAPYEAAAQAWSYCADKVSLSEWRESESILVLGSNEEHRAALDPINRLIFQRMTDLVLSQPDSKTRRTWFYLDEVRDAGNLESLGRLMTKGRSRGASVVLGFQDIEGMHDAFGKERAHEFIGQCSNKAVLRLNGHETALWSSQLFGKYEFMEQEFGENKGGSTAVGLTKTEGTTDGDTITTGTSEGISSGTSTGTSQSSGTSSGSSNTFGVNSSSNSKQWGKQTNEQTSEQVSKQTTEQKTESVAKQASTQSSQADTNTDTESWGTTINKKRMEKDALLPSEFMNLPVTNPENGLHGYYRLPLIGAFRGVLPGALLDETLVPPDKDSPNYLPRPASEQYLKKWTKSELKALGLKTKRDATQEKTDSKAVEEGQEFPAADAASGDAAGAKSTTEGSSMGSNPQADADSPAAKSMPKNIKRFLPGTDDNQGLSRL